MSSREEFMRSLGISPDDLNNPEQLEMQAQQRAEQRSALRAQKNPNASSASAAAPSASSSSRKAPVSFAAPEESAPVSSSSMRTSSYRRELEQQHQQEDLPRRSTYAGGVTSASSAAAASAAAFMSGETMSRPAPSPAPQGGSSAGGGSSQSRADFLRSMGIDNAGSEETRGNLNGIGGSCASSARQQQQQPSRSSAASIRDTLRRTEQNAHEEEALSPNISRKAPPSTHYGPRSSTSTAGAAVPSSSSSSSAAAAAATPSSYRRDAASPSVGAGLDASFSNLGRQGSASSLRRGSSSGRLDSSFSGSGAGGNPAVPLLDIAGNEVPLDASADDLKKHGNAFYEQGDFRKAVRFYSRAIEKAPHNEVLYSNRSAGYLLASKQMAIDTRTMALRDADKCIEIKPQWFKGYSRRGDALFKLERYDEACDAYREALQRDPSNAAIQASLEQCKACCAPKKDTSFAWSQPSDPFNSSRSGAEGGYSSRRAGSGSGSSSLNNSKNAHEMMEEYRVAAARANGSVNSGESAAEYREKQLAKYRAERGMKTSTASGGSGNDSLNNTTSSMNRGDDSSFSSSRSGGAAATDAYSTGAAAAYQQSLLESYRRKKAMQQQEL